MRDAGEDETAHCSRRMCRGAQARTPKPNSTGEIDDAQIRHIAQIARGCLSIV